MDFLGNVNVFQGRLQNGKAVLRGHDLEGLEFAYPDYPHQNAIDAQVYIRPHELEIERRPNGVKSTSARIVRIHPAGPVTKIQLTTVPQGIALSAELSRERYEELLLKDGELVYVAPRRVRVFLPEYVI
jgi:sulfate/thiosulfate transport system ATP-binding protein